MEATVRNPTVVTCCRPPLVLSDLPSVALFYLIFSNLIASLRAVSIPFGEVMLLINIIARFFLLKSCFLFYYEAAAAKAFNKSSLMSVHPKVVPFPSPISCMSTH